MIPPDALLAVPNVSEGRDADTIAAIAEAFGPVLDIHSDPDHNRSVYTLAGDVVPALLAGAREVIARVDLTHHEGVHPRIGALDVAPIVYRRPEQRGEATAAALVLADELGRLGLPVHLYGDLGRPRAEVRRNPGAPDFGPPQPHPTAGATLVTARPPLVAFNVEIEASLAEAKAIAALIREGGAEGLPGVRALGVPLARAVQVTTNIEDHHRATPADVVAAIRRHAPVTRAELVAMAPRAAFADFPEEVPMPGFDPARQLYD